MSTTDATDYTADIQLMTSVLTGQKISTAHSITGRRRDHVRPFAYLATLLACSTNAVVTATGLISPEGLDSVIVVSKSSHTDEERTEPFDLGPILGVGAPERTETLSLEEVLNPRPEQNPDLPTHARQLFDVLKLVDDGTVHPHEAETWVMSLCWRKLNARLKKIVTNWSPVSLIDLLKDWDPAPEEISGHLDMSGKHLADWRETMQNFCWLDESGNLPLCTVPRIIASILVELQDITDTPSTDDLEFVATATSILLALLRQDEVKRLFADTSLKNHIKPNLRKPTRRGVSCQSPDGGVATVIIDTSGPGATPGPDTGGAGVGVGAEFEDEDDVKMIDADEDPDEDDKNRDDSDEDVDIDDADE